MSHASNPATYKDAGVNLELYADSMSRLPALMQRTHAAHSARVLDLPGGFAGLFALQGPDRKYKDPVLVSGTDGVGTKIKVAAAARKYDTIGIDLVAMCVNDCLCLGAEPLFFLDYLAMGKDDPDLVQALVAGVSAGCLQARSALLGGETAIMPDLYAPGDFDLAGFSVGVVERDKVVDGKRIQPGDVLIGIPSSGFHSNGYSLIRRVIFDRAGLSVDDRIDELDTTVGELLLRPTTIYVDAVRRVLDHPALGDQVHGMAHITGGGLAENIERILPEGRQAVIDRGSWTIPAAFQWLQQLGPVEEAEMFRVFNMGIGYVLIVDGDSGQQTLQTLTAFGLPPVELGRVQTGPADVRFENAP